MRSVFQASGTWTSPPAYARVRRRSTCRHHHLLRHSAAMTVLALKLLLAPMLVVASSLAGRRWGPRMTGILVVLPIVAGPILLILYLEHGREFAAQAASAATLAIAPLALFALIFACLSRRHGWLLTLTAAWIAVLLVDLALSRVRVPAAVALSLAAVALSLAVLALHGAGALLRRLDQQPPSLLPTPWWDLPARAVATALLVVLVTGLATALGAELTGALAPFPIALSVVCAFTALRVAMLGFWHCSGASCRVWMVSRCSAFSSLS
jgi:hypothetical protein